MKTWQGIRQHTGAGPFRRLAQSALAAAAIVIAGPASSGQQPSNDARILVDATPGVVSFFVNSTEASNGTLTVRIADVMGETVFEMSSTAGYVDWMPADLPADGTYNFDAWYSPASAGDAPDSAVENGAVSGSTKGRVATEALYHSGTLSVEFGEIETYPVSGSAAQGRELSSINQEPSLLESVAGSVLEFLIPAAKAEQVFTEDVRIQTSAPQLFIEDTTSGGSDWDIGSNLLLGGWYLRDQGTNNSIFRVLAGAPANSLVVEGTGDIGLGTSTPDFKLHIADTAPGIRLEDTNDDNHLWQTYVTGKDYVIRDQTNFTSPVRIQDAAPTSSLHIDAFGRVGLGTSTQSEKLTIQGNTFGPNVGFRTNSGTKTWSIGATTGLMSFRDEANSRIPFAVATGAPADSIRVDGNGNIGIGTASPTNSIHVWRGDGSAQILVEDTGGMDGQTMFSLLNGGGHPKFRLQDASQSDVRWEFRTAGTEGASERFQMNKIGSGVIEFQLNAGGSAEFSGDVRAQGVLLTSAREMKTDFAAVDLQAILEKISALEVTEWRYKRENAGRRHIGPMADDFSELFGMGDGKHISAGDANGVLFAAIKALKLENETLRRELADIQDLRAEVGELQALLAALQSAD